MSVPGARLAVLNIDATLAALARVRPVFHSEADFQHALAWEIQRHYPSAAIRLERPITCEGRQLHLDLWAHDAHSTLAIELKYKTRPLNVTVGREEFHLQSHGAQDLGRYDVVKDIQRIEQICARQLGTVGYTILLTNDRRYWLPPRDQNSIDAAFRLTEGRVLRGACAWGVNAGAGTMRGREQTIVLHGEYPVRWSDYSLLGVSSSGSFRVLVLRCRDSLPV